MSLIVDYRNDDGDIVDIVDRIRLLDVELTLNAEQGTIGVSEIPINDSVATFAISGHRIMTARETDIDDVTDPWGGYAWIGYSAERGIARREMRTGAERGYAVQTPDLNTVLERRLLLGEDANRPAETDVERMQWLASTDELLLIDDTTYLSTEDPVDMEANDFRKQGPMAVIRGCMDQSGKNCFVTWVKGYDDIIEFSLWYGADSLPVLISDASICNIQSVVDADETGMTFYPVIETVLTRSPSRVYSGVVVDYDGGYVYVTRPETAESFALGGRDTTLSAPDVKSAAQATLRGERFLLDMATEEDSIRTAIIVPSEKLNVVMPGHQVAVRFSHLPGYQSAYVDMRVANRTFRPLKRGLYRIDLDLVAPAPPPPEPPAIALLHPMTVPDKDSTYIQGNSPHGTLVMGKEYRMVVDIIYRHTIPLGDGNCYAGLTVTITPDGGSESPIGFSGPGVDTFGIPGPTGTHYDGPWGEWTFANADFDILVGGSVLSGWYGAEAIVQVVVEERDP